MRAQKGLQQLLSILSTSPGGLVKTQIASLTLRDSDSVGLGWGWRMCISSEFPGDTDATGPGITL